MLDVITLQGEAKGMTIRNLDTGEITAKPYDALILATGGYGKIYYLSTLAMNCNATAIWRAHRKGVPSWRRQVGHSFTPPPCLSWETTKASLP